jgi:biopolymer transport protein ExbB
MDLINSLLKVMLATGASWVLWLLVGLSVVSIGIILERAYVFAKLSGHPATFAETLSLHLEAGDLEKAKGILRSAQGLEARIALEGLKAYTKGPDSVAEAVASAKAMGRTQLEDHLSFLGTLGNNAPFIGLFGTVVGIIKAFHDLSLDTSGAAKAVMAGISEALVATAMGLFVAIPAVLAFNYFQRRARAQLAATDGLTHMILSELRKQPAAQTEKRSVTRGAADPAASEEAAGARPKDAEEPSR